VLWYAIGTSNNTAIGSMSLTYNTSGSNNTAVGEGTMTNTTAGDNTALGYLAGTYNTTGSANTFVGDQAGGASGFNTLNNVSCLGYQSGVAAATVASNAVYLGNQYTSAIYGAMGGTTLYSYSDRRIKDNIQQNVPGLAFIDKLKPVTYNLNVHKVNELLGVTDSLNWDGQYDVEKVTQSGFIAQQVDSVAQVCGYDFIGVNKPKTSNGLYSLAYTAFVVPLVKSVQELSAKNDTITKTVQQLMAKNDSLVKVLQNMQACVTQLCANQASNNGGNSSNGGNSTGNNAATNVQDVTLSGMGNSPLIYQNIPNPFSTSTKINYYLPEGTQGASIIFFDNYGNQLKTIQLSQTGNGTLNLTPDNLASGIYSYSLVVNGNVVDTKRMVLQK